MTISWKTKIKLGFILFFFLLFIIGLSGGGDVNLVLVGAIGMLLSFIFGFTDIGQTTSAEEVARSRARAYDECDWCGRGLRIRYWYCGECGEVFCSERCLYGHKRNVHKQD